ncbi:hypothetical protein BN59_03323 [Legionella massiliensis]|uniref:Uncharacterized protein n=1 Tax=Legionella massiliensis TaxID=1034943 RepID=A0A078L522_9GAMM|nr:hypothetical protein [Legionella massiliensis]CDZ79008.1 hypothetical protein BN59_03323 [Legionella massiliensis]CEE14746.1 hypothetical protein BN1094_03323 [Legionella massiliensis]
MPTLPKEIRQFELNFICSVLHRAKIRTSQDLWDNFAQVFVTINQNPNIFKSTYTRDEWVEILKAGIKTYNNIDAGAIKLNDSELDTLFISVIPDEVLNPGVQLPPPIPMTLDRDLSKVTQSYDRLEISLEEQQTISDEIQDVMKDKDFVVVPHVILGTGDTGTTLWLEKFHAHHDTAKTAVKNKKMPSVLMIGKDAGSWNHNYTLAQPHNILERVAAKENPSAYMSEEYYQQNPYTNGRHVYQANQVSLAMTGAPLLRASVLKIEKQENHDADWKSPEKYRLVVSTENGIKHVYTNEVNICTGLGPARNAISRSAIGVDEFERLSQFNKKKEFTPIVDGNHFILKGSEEVGEKSRSIVVYGGGGTAAACYRKGFFGHDVRTEGRDFEKEQGQKHDVVWVAKQFNKAGTGRLATSALTGSSRRDELKRGELVKIEEQGNGKLLLTFKDPDNESIPHYPLECDQFIYSIGQDDSTMRAICEEVETDIDLHFDSEGMILNVSSPDKSIVFFGAAAMAVRETEYMAATWTWLKSENIGGDVGPGSMPPSRAQIKRYNFLNGSMPTCINSNMDAKSLVVAFLEDAGVASSTAKNFVADLIEARKHGYPANHLVTRTSGATKMEIAALLRLHKIDDLIGLTLHGHLVKKAQEPHQISQQSPQARLSWLNSNRKTNDSNVVVSTVSDEAERDNSLETTNGQVVKVNV